MLVQIHETQYSYETDAVEPINSPYPETDLCYNSCLIPLISKNGQGISEVLWDHFNDKPKLDIVVVYTTCVQNLHLIRKLIHCKTPNKKAECLCGTDFECLQNVLFADFSGQPERDFNR
jgi:hypothetical protein